MKAVIFDMDGVIIDSEPLHFEVALAVVKYLGIESDKEYFNKFVGVTNPVMWKIVKKELNISNSIEDLIELQVNLTIDLFKESGIEAIEGIIELMEELKKNKVPCAIGSSSPQVFIDAVVEKLEIEKYLEFSLSGETLPKSKPDPMIFLKAAETLGVEPKNCVVIEDSKHGVDAAKNAGMKCFGFKNTNSGNQDLSRADVIVNKISEINYQKIKEIFDKR